MQTGPVRADHSDAELEEAVRTRLAGLRAGTTACPSEVARALEPDNEAAWRALMGPVRAAAARLAAAGELVVTQAGTPVDPGTATGPVRLRPARQKPSA